MNDLAGTTVTAFRRPIMVVSPLVTDPRIGRRNNTDRASMLKDAQERLSRAHKNPDGGVLHVSEGPVENEKYWGGNGIEVQISKNVSAQELSYNWGGHEYVIYDVQAGKYFRDGVEQIIDKEGRLVPSSPQP